MKERKYVVLRYVSKTMNPSFLCGSVPYKWTSEIDAEDAEEIKREAESRWPDVSVTIEEPIAT